MAIGKRLNKAREGVDREKLYPLADAIKMVKERAKAKFDETIEVAINLGVDPRRPDGPRCRDPAERHWPYAPRRRVRPRRQG
jgi:ribosomal protein L1